MKKRGRKKKQVKQASELTLLQPIDQDGPVLDLEKSIIKKLKVYKGPNHDHESQQPTEWKLS